MISETDVDYCGRHIGRIVTYGDGTFHPGIAYVCFIPYHVDQMRKFLEEDYKKETFKK